MGFGTLGNGAEGISSSTSNLSALAPPFTVDRLNPRPNSNAFSNYSDSTYAVESFNPHSWQYTPPSAPGPEIVIDSPGINSGSIYDSYRFSAPTSVNPSSTQWSVLNSGTQTTRSPFSFGVEVEPFEPYYTPYVPALVGEDSLLIEDEGSRYNVVPTSGLSVTHSLFDLDLESGPQSADCWGFDDWKRVKRSDIDGSFSSDKANVEGSSSFINQLYQGGHGSGKRIKSKEDYGVQYHSLSQVSDRKCHTRSSSTELLEDKSCLEQNAGFVAYNSNRLVTPSSSLYPEFYPPVVSCEMQKNFPNYVSSCSPYEKCFRSVDTPFPGRASVVRASPSVVIRPPPATNGKLRQSVTSRKPASSENVGGIHGVNFGYNNPSKLKDIGFQSSSKIRADSFDASLFNFSKQGNGLVSSTSVKELSSPLHSKETSDRKVKARFGSQLPDINVTRSFAMTSDVPVVDSSEDSSDFIDHHSTAVDSPCWKGAPSSQFSTFDVGAGNSSHAKINIDERYNFGPEEHKNVHLMVDSDFTENVEGSKGKEHECAGNGVALALGRTLDAIRSTKEQSSSDGAKDTVWISRATNKGVELCDGPNMLNNECNLLNLMSVFDMKVSDTRHLVGEEGLTVNYVSDGAAVAVHAAEKVLASPASQEDATEHIIKPDPKLDVTAMIKAIHNLSELLQFHLSSDACSLEEDNMETLKHVISNLDSCLSKKVVQANNNPEPNRSHLGDTSGILGESRNAGTTSGDTRTKIEAAESKLAWQRNCSFPGKKDEKSLIFSPLGDDLDITGNDDMTKAIKMVLDENFQLSEEMHSRALLFKGLWLEAEAKLCSISYKARFNRMKIQMEEIKHKAPQENEHVSDITSHISTSPDPFTIPELSHNARDGPSLDPTIPYVSVPSTSGHADDVEASVRARFNILKSREGNMTPINMGEDQKPGMVDAVAESFMDRFNILKSREENSKSIGLSEEKQPQMIDGDVGFVMARLNILKLRDNPKMEEEKQPNTINSDFAGEKYLRSCIRGQLEDETLAVAQTPHQTASLNESNFVSCGDISGYESLNEYHLSVANDPMIRSLKGSMAIDENKSGSHDSSSSDWEHVLKEDFSWKNL
ncbi:hypothetical protein ACS0TY_000261 [Phlomoides rotata]